MQSGPGWREGGWELRFEEGLQDPEELDYVASSRRDLGSGEGRDVEGRESNKQEEGSGEDVSIANQTHEIYVRYVDYPEVCQD